MSAIESTMYSQLVGYITDFDDWDVAVGIPVPST